jgi:hypothetical protein
MKWPTIDADDRGKPPAPLAIRLLWMAAIWACSVGVLAVIALALRFALR